MKRRDKVFSASFYQFAQEMRKIFREATTEILIRLARVRNILSLNWKSMIFLEGGLESGGKDNTKQTNELLFGAL